jgi:hypothetical protein
VAFLVDPALRCLEAILKDPDHPQVLGAIKEVLARNELYGFGVEPKAAFSPTQAITPQTQVHMPEARVAGMSDQDLATYDKLLAEVRELLPKDEPKRIGGVSR